MNDLDITLTSVAMMACLVEGENRENLPSPLGICIVYNDILVCNILLSIVIIICCYNIKSDNLMLSKTLINFMLTLSLRKEEGKDS